MPQRVAEVRGAAATASASTPLLLFQPETLPVPQALIPEAVVAVPPVAAGHTMHPALTILLVGTIPIREADP
jgi:hypothetical protein